MSGTAVPSRYQTASAARVWVPKTGTAMREGIMSAVELPDTGKKKKVLLWPSVTMLVLLLGSWVFEYRNALSGFLVLMWLCFTVVCVVRIPVLLVLRTPWRSVSFLVPVLLVAAALFSPFFYARHYVEFRVYDFQHHIREQVRRNGWTYHEWHLNKHTINTDYSIVYDASDAIAGKDGVESGDCTDFVTPVGGHFYFHEEQCPGVL